MSGRNHNQATARALAFLAAARALVASFTEDPSVQKREEARLCRVCYFAGGFFGGVGVDPEIAQDRDLCTRCGADLDLYQQRLENPN